MFTTHRIVSKSEQQAVKRVMMSAFSADAKSSIISKFNFIRDCFGTEFLVFARADDGVIASGINTIPGAVYIDGVPVPHAGIGEVGTRPGYRKQGMATGCLKECHRLFQERDIHLSSLSPFAYYFYRMSGWEIGSSTMNIAADPQAFRDYEPGEVFFAGPDELGVTMKLYDRNFCRFNTSTVRSRLWWEKYPYLFSTPGSVTAYVKDSNGVPEAGAFIQRGIPEEPGMINMPELYYGDNRAIRRLLGGIKQLYPQHGIHFVLPAENDFTDYMANPRLLRRELHAGPQFRVHDPMKAVKYLKPRGEGELSFDITDPFEDKPWHFTVKWDGPMPRICEYTGVNPVCCTIQRFSQLFGGGVRINALNAGDFMDYETAETPCLMAGLMPVNQAYRSHLEPG